jgi:hypothetical protein
MSYPTGFHPIEWDVYKTLDAVNISNLKEIGRSPLHFRHRCAHEKNSATLTMGRTAHAAILEPARFDRDFVVWDRVTDAEKMSPRRGKVWDEFCQANRGKTIVTPSEHRFACNVRTAVRAKPVALKYLREGTAEQTMIWGDAATGRRCKGRLDWITNLEGVDALVGLKTSRDLTPRTFAAQAAKLSYHLQWAFYVDGYSVITGREPRVVEICVESEAPFDVVVYIIPSDVIEVGRESYRALLERLGECERTKRWPGRSENEVVFELPAYLRNDDDDEDVSDLGLDEGSLRRAADVLNEGLDQ